MVVMQEFVLPSYFVGNILTFCQQQKLVYLPVTGAGSISLSSLLHARSTITCCFDFVYCGKGLHKKEDFF